jgi:parallel beta-helix repeat protein
VVGSSDTGVGLHNCTETDVSNDTMINNMIAALLDACENSVLRGNNMRNNSYGAVVENSSGNIFNENDITNESNTALWTYYSHNNTFYHNSIESHELDVYINNSINAWDGGTKWSDGGNYWTNYTGVDLDRDGIGDSSKALDENNIDRYPLMGPYSSYNFSAGTLGVITNSTVEKLNYFGSNGTVELYVSNLTRDQTSAFIRLAIPHSMINVSNVKFIVDDGLTPLSYSNYSLYDNGTYRWIYVSFLMSTHKIDIVPEYSSLIALLLATGLTIILCRNSRRRLPRG